MCLEFVSKHLQVVMASEGYMYMVQTCPQLQAELLQVGCCAGWRVVFWHVAGLLPDAWPPSGSNGCKSLLLLLNIFSRNACLNGQSCIMRKATENALNCNS